MFLSPQTHLEPPAYTSLSNTSDTEIPPKICFSLHSKAYRVCNTFLIPLPRNNRYCVNNTPGCVCKHFTGAHIILATPGGFISAPFTEEKTEAGQWQWCWLYKLSETTKLNSHSSSLGQHRILTTRVSDWEREREEVKKMSNHFSTPQRKCWPLHDFFFFLTTALLPTSITLLEIWL